MAPRHPENKRYCAIGLMSGTSMDGIDVALLFTDGRSVIERGPGTSYPYDPPFRRTLGEALEQAKQIVSRDARPGQLAALDREIALRHSVAVDRFLASNKLSHHDVDVIGFHGQTVLHRPNQSLTVQLGDGQLLADETGIAVVHDMRAHDMQMGGQGAPLVPAYHRALAGNLKGEHAGQWPIAFVNIGGIANITWISRAGKMIAFDTGPGNALIDQWVGAKAGIAYDQGGAIASEGSVVESLAEAYLAESFFQKPVPKSLDRKDFLPPAPESASLADGAKTLAHVTAAAIVKALDHVPQPPELLVICGGGRKNMAIMAELEALLAKAAKTEIQPARLVSAEAAGFDGDTMEAEAWAYLAVRSVRGLAISWPGTTGIAKAASGGKLARPDMTAAAG